MARPGLGPSGRRPRSRPEWLEAARYGETRTRTGDTAIFSCGPGFRVVSDSLDKPLESDSSGDPTPSGICAVSKQCVRRMFAANDATTLRRFRAVRPARFAAGGRRRARVTEGERTDDP